MKQVVLLLKNEGLINVLLKLKDAAKGDQELIGKLYGRIEGLTGAKILTGEGFDKFVESLENMTDGVDELTAMYKLQTSTLHALWQLIKNFFGVALIEVGRIIKEVFAPEIEWIRDMLGEFADREGPLFIKFLEETREVILFLKEVFDEVYPSIEKFVTMTYDWTMNNKELIKTIVKITVKLAPFIAAFWAISKVGYYCWQSSRQYDIKIYWS